MLTMPKNAKSVVTIIGIDPGSTNLGVAIIRFSAVYPHEILSTEAFTIRADRLLPKGAWVSDSFGDRQSRLHILDAELSRVFAREEPIQVATESPFYNRLRPNAYGVLVEVICVIRRAVMRWNRWTNLFLIDPPTVKNSVGAKGNAKKEDMRERVLALAPVFKFEGGVLPEDLDEHSIDASAVAYGRYISYLGELCLIN